jgi:hypothetical protein
MSVVTTPVHRTMPMLCLLSMGGSIGCHDPRWLAMSLISIDYYKQNNYDNNYNLQSGPITMTLFSWSAVKMRILMPIQNELPSPFNCFKNYKYYRQYFLIRLVKISIVTWTSCFFLYSRPEHFAWRQSFRLLTKSNQRGSR